MTPNDPVLIRPAEPRDVALGGGGGGSASDVNGDGIPDDWAQHLHNDSAGFPGVNDVLNSLGVGNPLGAVGPAPGAPEPGPV